MSDEQFTYFATHEAGDLVPDAVEVLRQVMKERRTVPDPDNVIDIQRRQLSPEEFETLVTRFRQQPCPSCAASGELLNGVSVNRAGRSELMVGCKSCLEQEIKSVNKASIGYNLLHPASGLAASIQNEAALKELDRGDQTQALRE